MYKKTTYLFLEEWDENTEINWWNESRKKLNKIIRDFNQWQINGFDGGKMMKLLAKIEYGKQTIGSIDGGSGYMEELEKMETFVKSHIL